MEKMPYQSALDVQPALAQTFAEPRQRHAA